MKYSKVSSRDSYIDFLRFLGLSLIILAHVSPPSSIFHLRCFDVCLMIFISGLSFSNKIIDNYKSFLIHRIFRLLVPVYIFHTAFFFIIGMLKLGGVDFEVSIKQIIESYLLFGYMWIIRVFLIIALLTPLLIKINTRIKTNVLFFGFLLVLLIILQISICYQIGISNVVFKEFIYPSIGYSLVFMCGLRIKDQAPERLRKIVAIAVILLAFCLLYFYFSIGGGIAIFSL